MNCALCFIPKELEQARRWFDWCAELGGVSAHPVFIMPFRGMSFDKATVKGWKSVTLVTDWMGIESEWASTHIQQRSADGPNSSFRQLARHFADNNLGPWCFVEVDAIPLVPDWLDRIEAEYRRAGRKYMGNIVRVDTIPEHMTGNGVYAQDTAHTAVNLMLPRYAVIEGKQLEVAFDVAGAPDILPNAHITNLIQHRFRAAPITTREEFETLVDKNAVLYHSDKLGSTIPFIRENLSGRTGTQREPAAAVSLFPAHATPTGKSKVYTYFSPVASAPGKEEQIRLLNFWQKSWSEHGWEPVVLTETDARKHPRFEEWAAGFAKLPSANPDWYERACWHRWVAMVVVGGGLLTDYDTINAGFTPADYPKMLTDDDMAVPVCLRLGVPCAVGGTAHAFETAIGYFVATEDRFQVDGREHVSDMHLIQKWKWFCMDVCQEYKAPDWTRAPLVHFGHYSTQPRKRSEAIEEWLAKKPLMEAGAPILQATGKISAETFKGPMTILPADYRIEQVPATWIGKVRAHVGPLIKLADTPSRKILLMKELRKQGLIGKPKKRKRKKWKF